MADPKQQTIAPKKILARCGERVIIARMASDWGGAFWFRANTTLIVGQQPGGGIQVEALALHPAGLAVLHQGKRYIVPGAHVEAVVIAEDEA